MAEEQNTPPAQNPPVDIGNGVPPVPKMPAAAAPSAETPSPAQTAAPTGAVASISERMSEAAAKPPADAQAPSTAPSNGFDISSLTPDQLMALKALLGVTPDSPTPEKTEPIIQLRNVVMSSPTGENMGGVVVAIKNAYVSHVRDELANTTRETIFIPIQLLDYETGKGAVNTDGTPKFINIEYPVFMGSPRIKAKVVSQRSVNGRIIDGGLILNKITGRMIQREITTVETFFTVELPADVRLKNGAKVPDLELEATIVNA